MNNLKVLESFWNGLNIIGFFFKYSFKDYWKILLNKLSCLGKV